ncbi:MAG: hypothetical protein IKN27_06165, partial [Selenomonadaceae bacterium]|nr:hypothetical protein [Selenomonadaceae bacterium]
MSAEFIKLISDLQSERFNVHLAELATNYTPCGIFFGFELTPSFAVTNIKNFVKMGLNVTCAIVLADRVAEVLKNFVDVPVVALEDISRFGEENFPVKPQEVFLTTNLDDSAFAPYFSRYGIESIFTAGQTEEFLYYMKHLPELYAVHESFIDDESKKVFRAAIKGSLTGKLSDFRFTPELLYSPNGFMPTAGDIVIDGGVYDGATSESFAKLGAKVFSFEMDENNFKKCLARVGGNPNITLEKMGLSDKEGEETYSSFYMSSHKDSDGNLTAKFIDLDTYVERKNLPRV